jgi:phosphoglycolate phosphatase-like HAD superfamily hydrolase
MLLSAMKKHGLTPQECAIVGDSEKDILAGKAAKLGTTILVGNERKKYTGGEMPDEFCEQALDAARLLVRKGSKTKVKRVK